MDIDLQIKIEQLISECKNTKEPMIIEPDEFCDLLNSPEIEKYTLNQRIKFKDPPIQNCDDGYYHLIKYECFKFFTITTVPITEV
jgi:hypothetical protein